MKIIVHNFGNYFLRHVFSLFFALIFSYFRIVALIMPAYGAFADIYWHSYGRRSRLFFQSFVRFCCKSPKGNYLKITENILIWFQLNSNTFLNNSINKSNAFFFIDSIKIE